MGSNCTQDVKDQTLQRKAGELDLEDMVGVFMILGVSLGVALIIEVGKKITMTVQKHKGNKKEVNSTMYTQGRCTIKVGVFSALIHRDMAQ